jgi:antitoxin FitA
MAAITIRRLSDQTHESLKARAARAGRSTEAEIRAILDEAANQEQPKVGIGTAIHQMAMKYGGFDLKIPPRKGKIEPAVFD